MPIAGESSNFVAPLETNPGCEAQMVPLVLRPSEPSCEPKVPEAGAGVEACQVDPVPVIRSMIWGVPFDCVTMQQGLARICELIERRVSSYVITANLNYVMLHNQRPEMSSVTSDAAMILADGQPIVWRSRWTSCPLPERVAGSEMIYSLAERARDRGWGIYLLGGASGVAVACAKRLVERYPGLKISGVESPPFRQLSPQEQRQQDARILASGADLLLVAFGQPKGEIWIHQNHQRLGVPVSIQLGASFDFIAGSAKRAPRIWQCCGMEWAYRMFSDPRRLVPRYGANFRFLMRALIRDLKRLAFNPRRPIETL